MNPRIGEGRTAVLDRGGELVGRTLRVVGAHPLLASSQVELGPQLGLDLLGQLAHLGGGPHMVASAGCLELDLVEVFDVCHSSHGTPAVLVNSYGFGAHEGVAALRETFDFRSLLDHTEVAG